MDYNKIRGAAMAYYANSSHEEQLQAWKFFKSLDTDGNGTVSRQEYLSFLKKEGYTDTQIAFGMLDRNGDGGLDFEECTTLFYIIRVHHGAVSCKNGCGAFLWPGDIYFVCAECYEAGGKTYDLCCDCYRKKNFKHQHAVFFDNFKLLKRMQPTSASQRILEELVKTARLYYEKSSPNVKESARNFFTVLDYDNDEKVSLQQFLGFMRETGHTKMCSHRFFKELDIDGNGTLEFMEVMALYYIIKSGRPFCGGCGQFIPGMYFTCFKCFENGKNSFCVCPECYDDERFIHEHVQFLDNYALLEAKRLQVIAEHHKPSSSVTITELPINDVVRYVQKLPKPHWENLVYKAAEVALKALDLAIEVALKGVQLASCTIM